MKDEDKENNREKMKSKIQSFFNFCCRLKILNECLCVFVCMLNVAFATLMKSISSVFALLSCCLEHGS